jgi:hypothetical protein
MRLDALALSLSPCCPRHRADRCGVDVSHFAALHDYDVGCLELDAPGVTDPQCPSVTVMTPAADTVTLSGCRVPSGQCGYDVRIPDLIDLGCTPPPQRTSPRP